MRISIIAASNRQPAWVTQGFADYAKRLRRNCVVELVEVPLARRSASQPVARAVATEGERMLAAVSRRARVVALDATGVHWSTAELALRLRAWLAGGAPLALFIGGPDGLAPACLERADERWALSRLTLPHGLVRIAVAEALYRAASLLEGHPYHRG